MRLIAMASAVLALLLAVGLAMTGCTGTAPAGDGSTPAAESGETETVKVKVSGMT